MIYEFFGQASIDDELDGPALDRLARDLELLDEREADRRHPCDVARDVLLARHVLTGQLVAGGLELRDARSVAAIVNPAGWIHFLDGRRASGYRDVFEAGRRTARITQHPVICALDIVELDAGVADDVTYEPAGVTCPDCLERLEAGRNE